MARHVMLVPLPRPESAPAVERMDASATVPSSGNNSVAKRSRLSLAECVEEGKTVAHNAKAHIRRGRGTVCVNFVSKSVIDNTTLPPSRCSFDYLLRCFLIACLSPLGMSILSQSSLVKSPRSSEPQHSFIKASRARSSSNACSGL